MDLSKPQFLFAVTWTIAFLLATTVETTLSVSFGWEMYLLAFGGMISFYLIAGAVNAFRPITPAMPRFPRLEPMDMMLLSSFVVRVFIVWLIGFFINVGYSGGLPIIWLLLGDGRNYIDFGVPSVSGLLNMMRAFMTASIFLLYLEKRATRRDYWLLAFLLASALAEVSRGVVAALILQVFALVVLLRPVKPAHALAWVVVVIAASLLFDYVGNVRTQGGTVDLGEVLGGQFQDNSLLSNFVWSFTYVTTPLNNLAYAISQHPEPTMVPFYTLQPMLPTVIRSMIWSANDYPIELINEAFNATTFYSPLLADFGVWGAFFSFMIIQLLISLAYNAAKRGRLFGILVYPPIFATVVLSFFYSFFFSLPFLSYPLIVIAFMIFRRRTLARVYGVRPA